MSRKPERRNRPMLQVLEGRDVPSGLVPASPVVAPTSGGVAVVAPSPLLSEPAPGRVPGPGGASGIIAILIGL